MNRLKLETSPYLLQHANNPVDWYPWGPAAFKRAKEEDKPILVSIGYSSCHWCHVMEKESFEDPAVANYMNEYFINIKVDREEHPDVDSLYMDAVQFITGRGGWPLNVFLTPELLPFYGGTYYPPVRKHGMPSWMEILQHVSNLFFNNRSKVEEVGQELILAIKKHQQPQVTKDYFKVYDEPKEEFRHLIGQYRARQDEKYGGFGGAPKFPSIADLRFLLDAYVLEGDQWSGNHLVKTVDSILEGGIYDHIGGGITRYSTTRDWGVPHFEKMLYDNALLLGLLADITRSCLKRDYSFEIQNITEWLNREMSNGEGGYYSAMDADSDGEEGKFYVWTQSEMENILGDKAMNFAKVFDITKEGNWEGKNIPRIASDAGYTRTDASKLEWIQAKKQLLDYRNKNRIKPDIDRKILPDWNALLVTAWCKSYSATGDKTYLEYAQSTISYLIKSFLQPDYRLYHRAGDVPISGNLDDSAFLVEAFGELYATTMDISWITLAERVMNRAIEDFYDKQNKIFYFTSKDKIDIIVRKIIWQDIPIPSGFATITRELHRLGIILKRVDWVRHSEEILLKAKHRIYKYPMGHGRWLSMVLYDKMHTEVGIIGDNYEGEIEKLRRRYIPHCVLSGSKTPTSKIPYLTDKEKVFSMTVYLCKEKTCFTPVKKVESIATEIEGYNCQ